MQKHLTTLRKKIAASTAGMPAIFGGDGTIGPFDLNSVTDILIKIASNIISYVGLIAVIMIIIAGTILIVNGGNESSRDRAKKIIIYTVIGIVVILLSSALVNAVLEAISS